jgi:uncharacterized protein Smg (DUF494 family)
MMETSIETLDDLKKELKKAGYSKKAISEILKWIPSKTK